MKCTLCSSDVPPSKRECPACGQDNGYPNVRQAELTPERTALLQRLHDAEVSANARNCKSILEQFGLAVLKSQAAISRPLAIVQGLIEDDNAIYTNYHKQIATGSRIPENNFFDSIRTQFEAALFPNYHQEIVFACLTLESRGLAGYGPCTMVLKETMIAHRATVFEENPYNFCNKRHILLSQALPPGFRAVWAERDVLAKAKLQPEITPTTRPQDFAGILVMDRGGSGDSDFIEVHIFGTLNRNTIESIVCKRPRSREDRLIWQRLGNVLAKIGVKVETT